MSFVANYSELPFSRMTWGLGWGLEHSYCNALLYLFVPGSVYFQTQIKQSYSALTQYPRPVLYLLFTKASNILHSLSSSQILYILDFATLRALSASQKVFKMCEGYALQVHSQRT